MTASAVRAWRCEVCGYIHEGPEPPAECPVCGVPASSFAPCEPPAAAPAPAADPAAPARRIVVVGGGIAGVAAAEAARQASAGSEIAVVAGEPGLPYWRLNLTRLLDGEIGEDALALHPAAWYAEKGLRLLAGVTAAELSTERREVRCSDGTVLPFDKLVLAVGAQAFVPSWPGVGLDGVFAVRTLADARGILRRMRPGLRCVCAGGGILGLETAGALARRGAQVDLLAADGWLMPRQLTREGGAILAGHVASLGIRLHTGARLCAIMGEGRVAAVELEDGRSLPADLVIVTTGIRADLSLARAAGLRTQQGIVVDDTLTTSHPDVLAAGDCAEHRGVLYGLWPAAQYQGTIAGLNAAGQANLFGGLPRLNVLKVLGLHVYSIGRFDGEGARVLEEQDAGRYVRFVFRDGLLEGAILIGRDGLDAALKTAIEGRRDFSAVLAGSPTASAFAAHLAAGPA